MNASLHNQNLSVGITGSTPVFISMFPTSAGWMGCENLASQLLPEFEFTAGNMLAIVDEREVVGTICGFWAVLNSIVTACIWNGIQYAGGS